MSDHDWLNTNDAILGETAQAMSAKFTATPLLWGILASDAALFATLVSAYLSALSVSLDPQTRTKGTVAAKQSAKISMVSFLRALVRRVQANTALTPQQRADLGIPQHSDSRKPTGAPVTRVVASILGIAPGQVTIDIADELTPAKRKRPAGTIGAAVYSFVAAAGEAVPEDLEQFRFEGLATRSRFTIGFNPADAGKTATIVLVWMSPRGESGPRSMPITVTVAA
jgi:hypothetical protein